MAEKEIKLKGTLSHPPLEVHKNELKVFKKNNLSLARISPPCFLRHRDKD